jgi:ABC-type phosphate/phosphonate transport system ATPase subunit
MSDEDEDRVYLARELCEAIIEASERISSLDPDLAYDVLEQIEEKDWVSEGQLTALQNIATGFHLKI